jgi:hypothetical protein
MKTALKCLINDDIDDKNDDTEDFLREILLNFVKTLDRTGLGMIKF